MQKRKLLELVDGWVDGVDSALHIRFHPYAKLKYVELDDMPTLPVLIALDDDKVVIKSGAMYAPRSLQAKSRTNSLGIHMPSNSMSLPTRPGYETYTGLTTKANVERSWKLQFWRDYLRLRKMRLKYNPIWKSWIRPALICTVAFIISRHV